MGTNGHAECMENTFVVFCLRNGGLLCNQKKELETIVAGKGKTDLFALSVRCFLHSSSAYSDMAEILSPGSGLFPQSVSSLVPGLYISLCDTFVSCFLLPEKERKWQVDRMDKKTVRESTGIAADNAAIYPGNGIDEA